MARPWSAAAAVGLPVPADIRRTRRKQRYCVGAPLGGLLVVASPWGPGRPDRHHPCAGGAVGEASGEVGESRELAMVRERKSRSAFCARWTFSARSRACRCSLPTGGRPSPPPWLSPQPGGAATPSGMPPWSRPQRFGCTGVPLGAHFTARSSLQPPPRRLPRGQCARSGGCARPMVASVAGGMEAFGGRAPRRTIARRFRRAVDAFRGPVSTMPTPRIHVATRPPLMFALAPRPCFGARRSRAALRRGRRALAVAQAGLPVSVAQPRLALRLCWATLLHRSCRGCCCMSFGSIAACACRPLPPQSLRVFAAAAVACVVAEKLHFAFVSADASRIPLRLVPVGLGVLRRGGGVEARR